MTTISPNPGFIEKLKTKFHKKSIDQEIDDAFNESNSYSKKVLESTSRLSPKKEQLSSGYILENQPEPPKPLIEPGLQDHDSLKNQQMFNIDDPLALPKGMDRPPPQPDSPLQIPEVHRSTDEQKRQFFNQPQLSGRAGIGPADINTILLEIKDLRTQNEHIIDILKNIQDRLRGY